MTALFLSYFIQDWEVFHLSIINEHNTHQLKPNINAKESFNSS